MSEQEFEEYGGPLEMADADTADAEFVSTDGDAFADTAALDADDLQQRDQFEAGFREHAVDDATADAVNADAEATAASDAASQPYLGRWHQLISSTNWEKGRIISDWRAALVEAGASAAEYSDEAWARRAGGVTSPHVGRLRRVFDRFGDQYESYPGLYWSHFLAAMDWEDAPLWLEGAMRSGWSVSQMRQQRWEAGGGQPDQRPREGEIIDADVDEDVVIPAQGGGRSGKYDDEQPSGVSAGPLYEGPDFGEEAPFGDQASIGGQGSGPDANGVLGVDDSQPEQPRGELVQPFKNLPDLPDDLAEAVEMLKLAVLRHKADQWRQIAAEDVVKYLVGLRMLIESRGE